MSARQLARISNDFEPSPSALAVTDLLNTSEVAAVLGVSRMTVVAWAKALGVPCVAMSRRHPGRITRARGQAHIRYWSRQQIELLRGLS